MTASNAKTNDPNKVDTLMGGFILLATGLVVGAISFMNVGPYRDLIYKAIAEWGWVDWIFTVPVLGSLLDGSVYGVALVIGAAIFVGIQLGEVWPLVTAMKTSKAKQWGSKMLFLVSLACVCYALDAIACSFFWPPLKVPLEQFRWAALLSDVAWGNLFVTLVTLFGLSAYVWLWRQIARVM